MCFGQALIAGHLHVLGCILVVCCTQAAFMHHTTHRSDEAPNASTFKRLAKQQFKLAGVLAGCHEYCAVTFGKGHAALCNVGLHATPLGYVTHKAGSSTRCAALGCCILLQNCCTAHMLVTKDTR